MSEKQKSPPTLGGFYLGILVGSASVHAVWWLVLVGYWLLRGW